MERARGGPSAALPASGGPDGVGQGCSGSCGLARPNPEGTGAGSGAGGRGDGGGGSGSAARQWQEQHVVPDPVPGAGPHCWDAEASSVPAGHPRAPLWGISWSKEGVPLVTGTYVPAAVANACREGFWLCCASAALCCVGLWQLEHPKSSTGIFCSHSPAGSCPGSSPTSQPTRFSLGLS